MSIGKAVADNTSQASYVAAIPRYEYNLTNSTQGAMDVEKYLVELPADKQKILNTLTKFENMLSNTQRWNPDNPLKIASDNSMKSSISNYIKSISADPADSANPAVSADSANPPDKSTLSQTPLIPGTDIDNNMQCKHFHIPHSPLDSSNDIARQIHQLDPIYHMDKLNEVNSPEVDRVFLDILSLHTEALTPDQVIDLNKIYQGRVFDGMQQIYIDRKVMHHKKINNITDFVTQLQTITEPANNNAITTSIVETLQDHIVKLLLYLNPLDRRQKLNTTVRFTLQRYPHVFKSIVDTINDYNPARQG